MARRVTNQQYFVYTLLLANNNFYVGITNNPSRRVNEHSSHVGAEWTKLFPPLQVVQVKPLPLGCTKQQLEFYETLETLSVMRQVGWRRVRGGAFVRVNEVHTARMLKDSRNQAKYRYNASMIGL